MHAPNDRKYHFKMCYCRSSAGIGSPRPIMWGGSTVPDSNHVAFHADQKGSARRGRVSQGLSADRMLMVDLRTGVSSHLGSKSRPWGSSGRSQIVKRYNGSFVCPTEMDPITQVWRQPLRSSTLFKILGLGNSILPIKCLAGVSQIQNIEEFPHPDKIGDSHIKFFHSLCMQNKVQTCTLCSSSSWLVAVFFYCGS